MTAGEALFTSLYRAIAAYSFAVSFMVVPFGTEKEHIMRALPLSESLSKSLYDFNGKDASWDGICKSQTQSFFRSQRQSAENPQTRTRACLSPLILPLRA